ncbi:MAG: zinc-binding protein, partial [Bacteroidota bacterium]|nr:zinc-binding protein [Bacteroidota bacterium]
IDGCPLACAKACLNNHHVVPDLHLELTEFGVSKKQHEDFNMNEANELLLVIKDKIQGCEEQIIANEAQLISL